MEMKKNENPPKHEEWSHIPLFKYSFHKNENEYKKEPIPKKILSFIESGKKILDAGCGKGDKMLQLKSIGNQVWGIDIDSRGIELAKGKNLNVSRVDFNCDIFPFENDFFDIIVSFDVIEHIYNGRNYIKECYRILKPNGKFIVFTPNYYSFSNLKKKWSQIIGTWDWNDANVRHYSPFILKKRLETVGFNVQLYPKQYRYMHSETIKGGIAGKILPFFLFSLFAPSIFAIGQK